MFIVFSIVHLAKEFDQFAILIFKLFQGKHINKSHIWLFRNCQVFNLKREPLLEQDFLRFQTGTGSLAQAEKSGLGMTSLVQSTR